MEKIVKNIVVMIKHNSVEMELTAIRPTYS